MTGDEVRAAVFPYRLNGYSPRHVDLFLLRVADLLDDGQIIDGDALPDRFPKVMRGYDGAAVDQFISSLAGGGLVASQLPTAARGNKTRRSRDPAPAKLRKANAASQVYYHFSHERSDASFREQYRQECEASWAEFFVAPGTRLKLTGSEISGNDGVALMTRRRRTWTETSSGRAFQFTLGAAVVDVRTGDQILTVSGDHRAYAAEATVERRQETWLWFPIQGTSIADAVMAAIDFSGSEIIRFRRSRTGDTEVIVSPDHPLSSDVLCVIAVAGPLLESFFVASG